MHRGVSLSRLIAFTAVAALAVAGSRAQAQQAQPVDLPGLPDQQSVWTIEQFDQWVDQIVEQINEQESPEGGRLDTRLTLTLDWLEASCRISENQKKKLQVAGRGDIKRFFDEMRDMKRRYRQVKGDAKRFGEMQRRLAEFQTSFGDDVFGESSLFSKMLQKTLSPQQAEMYVNARAEARSFAQRAAVDQAVRFFDIAVGFNDRQRGQLTDLLLEETRQLQTSEYAQPTAVDAVVSHAAGLSSAKLSAIFDKRQAKIFNALLKHLKAGAGAGNRL